VSGVRKEYDFNGGIRGKYASRARSSSKLIVLVAALAAVGTLAWFVLRSGSTHETERADKPKVELPKDSQADLSTDNTPLEARSAEKGDAGAGEKAPASASSGTGTLHIRVLDETTHAPVPDLQFVAYRERGGTKELGRGRTDAQGRAELHEVESNTVVVRTERKPPHAEQTGAVWLTPGATTELELLVGAGGAIVGRVIDDLQRPIEGAALVLEQFSGGIEGFSSGAREPEARSASDGRFRIECLASRPRAVWVVDGQMRPEDWNEVSFKATFENVSGYSRAMPLPGKDVDAGDIALERAAIFAGHVLDSNGRTAAGALLSLEPSRSVARLRGAKGQAELAIGPGQPGFRLLPGEVLANAAGEFEIHGAPTERRVIVWTSDDVMQGFDLPACKPGERVEGIELKLAVMTRVELELVDAAGAVARVPASGLASGYLRARWRTGLMLDDRALVRLRSSDGKSASSILSIGKDGVWRSELQVESAQIVRLEVWASGYQPIVEESATGFPPLVRRRLELAGLPSFRVRLVPKDPGVQPLDAPVVLAHLHVCMAEPVRHAKAGLGCCGLGVYWDGPWHGEPLVLTLPVRRKGAFWIYAVAQARGQDYRDIASIGPFEPNSEEHEFALDPAKFVTEQREARQPPEPSAPGESHKAKLRAHVVDSRTGAALPGAFIQLREIGTPPKGGLGAGANADENGDVLYAHVRAGRWLVSAIADKHRRADIGERTTSAGETLELGTIALDPLQLHHARVIGADGKPGDGQGRLVDLAGSEHGESQSDWKLLRGGKIEIDGDLPPKFVLEIAIFGGGEGQESDSQRFPLVPWPDDEVKELRFAPSRRVIVTVLGLDPDESALTPKLCPAPGEPTAHCDHRLPLEPEHQPLARGTPLDRTADPLRYAVRLVPGRYQIWGSNLMHELPVTELEVTPGATDIELTITAR